MLTPHSGELARLLDTSAEEIDAHRLAAVRRAASRFGSWSCSRGPTRSSPPRARACWSPPTARPSLATAGSGDVLTGVIAALLAKGLEPRLAAATGAVVHGLASRLVEPQAGLVASDLLPGIRRALAGDGWDLPPLA